MMAPQRSLLMTYVSHRASARALAAHVAPSSNIKSTEERQAWQSNVRCMLRHPTAFPSASMLPLFPGVVLPASPRTPFPCSNSLTRLFKQVNYRATPPSLLGAESGPTPAAV